MQNLLLCFLSHYFASNKIYIRLKYFYCYTFHIFKTTDFRYDRSSDALSIDSIMRLDIVFLMFDGSVDEILNHTSVELGIYTFI